MIGNAVPPLLAYEVARSIASALQGLDLSLTATKHLTPKASTPVLVGYYKSDRHKRLILKNKIYYVRSDGRSGSMFQKDCSTIPKYLLMHHKEIAELYELENEDPTLVDASFLQKLGFPTKGDTYLCFRLKEIKSKD